MMATAGFLQATKKPNLDEIKAGLSGNICRCGNYENIYRAVSAAAKKMGRS
jgi:aerobic-type carbon monoxide dehydrogenase small subunit (CoxS/CutS family)